MKCILLYIYKMRIQFQFFLLGYSFVVFFVSGISLPYLGTVLLEEVRYLGPAWHCPISAGNELHAHRILGNHMVVLIEESQQHRGLTENVMYQHDFYKCPFVLHNYALHIQFHFHASGISQPLSSKLIDSFNFSPSLSFSSSISATFRASDATHRSLHRFLSASRAKSFRSSFFF